MQDYKYLGSAVQENWECCKEVKKRVWNEVNAEKVQE